MKRWIVNPRTHEVRRERGGVDIASLKNDRLQDGEFFFDAPTAADAAMAGRRHNLAVEALETVDHADSMFVVVGDRIEPQPADGYAASGIVAELASDLDVLGFEVWREGLALLVLAKRVQGTEGIHAWVSEIGSDR